MIFVSETREDFNKGRCSLRIPLMECSTKKDISDRETECLFARILLLITLLKSILVRRRLFVRLFLRLCSSTVVINLSICNIDLTVEKLISHHSASSSLQLQIKNTLSTKSWLNTTGSWISNIKQFLEKKTHKIVALVDCFDHSKYIVEKTNGIISLSWKILKQIKFKFQIIIHLRKNANRTFKPLSKVKYIPWFFKKEVWLHYIYTVFLFRNVIIFMVNGKIEIKKIKHISEIWYNIQKLKCNTGCTKKLWMLIKSKFEVFTPYALATS